MIQDYTSTDLNVSLHESSCSPPLSDESQLLLDKSVRCDNDLQLAAELGKALLSRNRLLEQQLEKSRSDNRIKDSELERLHKHVLELRDASVNKYALVDEVDARNQELDRTNQRLSQQSTADKKKIARLISNVATLEQQISDLLDQVDHLSSLAPRMIPRPRSATYTDSVEHWSLRSDSHSPPCLTPPLSVDPYDRLLTNQYAPHLTRPKPFNMFPGKGLFIDDEMTDQPQLSSTTCESMLGNETGSRCTLHVPPWRTNEDHLRSTGSQIHVDGLRLYRSISWPCLFAAPKSGGNVLQEELWATSGMESSGSPYPRDPIGKSSADRLSTLQVPPFFSSMSHTGGSHREPNHMLYDPSGWSKTEDRSRTTSIQQTDDVKTLQRMLDDATFIQRSEAISQMKLRCQQSHNHEPGYKRLFKDAFRLIRQYKSNLPIDKRTIDNQSPIIEESGE